jgi:hypothetical protein
MALPWGLSESADATGRYERPMVEALTPAPALVLTEKGDVLVRRGAAPATCVVALQVGKSAVLTQLQSQRMGQLWDIALALTGGCSDDIHLQPMPAQWRFVQSDFQSWDEWMGAQSIAPRCVANSRDGTGARR